MVFGSLASERLQLNEKTLWTGGPGADGGYDHGNWRAPRPDALAAVRGDLDDRGRLAPDAVAAALGQPRRGYGAHQTLGDLRIDVAGAPACPDTSYRRALDLRQAVASVAYTHQGTRHTREFFASHPDGVLVGRLGADRPGAVTCTLRTTSPRDDVTATADGDRITVRGELADNGLTFETQIRVAHRGGTLTAGADGSLTVTGADQVWFVLAAATAYADTYPRYRGDDPHRTVTRAVDTALARGHAELRARHVRDHRALFDRVALDLGQSTPPDVPTDQLLKDYGKAPAADRALEALFFQYGRYLLIASSRPGSLPANLQGGWNHSTAPPWSADYHVNINLQMNYWPAEAANLAETTAPYDRFVEALREPGRRTAREMFGAPGWVVHNETNPYGFTGVHDWATAFWFPEAAAWLTAQLYEHYRFGGSTRYLRDTAYPVMKEAAAFWLDQLRTDPRDGTLVVTPSYSPEHGDFTVGAAMSQQIVHDLLTNTLEAARVLGDDPAFRTRLEQSLDRLDPGLRVGSWGSSRSGRTTSTTPATTTGTSPTSTPCTPVGRSDPAASGRRPPRSPSRRAATAAPAGPRPGRSTSGRACATATTPTRCSPNSSSPPRCPTSGTPTRRSRSTATSAPRPGSSRCSCRASTTSSTCCPPCPRAGRPARRAACGHAAAPPSTSPGPTAAPPASSCTRRAPAN
ncbi:alpha-L-fucosidase [Streptomyces alboflavus]|uniref:Alpha-L-fucosidase n=1 Tax=Streptomyces alboflavus TaxID=67267 RepID=A0A1Z1W4E2_9ACTN|nr:alpha-L-fucosidase [Streptomyces alboflavus]